MDYLCGKFGDCSFSRFGSIVQTVSQTDTQTDAIERFILAISSARVKTVENKSIGTM